MTDLSNTLPRYRNQEAMNINRIPLFSLVALLTLSLFTGCSSGEKAHLQFYEGFMGHALRVYVKVPLPDEEKEYTEKEITVLLKKAARRRATVLVTGYFQVNHPAMMNNPLLVREIMAAFEKDKIFLRDCNDGTCSALVDYNMKKVMAMTGKKPEPDDESQKEKKQKKQSR